MSLTNSIMVASIECLSCNEKVGYVHEHELRPGVWANSCHPDPMPYKCDKCSEVLTRVNV